MADGSGVAELYPSVNDMKDLKSYGNFPCIIRNGYDSETNVVEMLGIPKLTDVEINNIINYVLNDLNSLEYDTKIMEVQKLLDNCK